MTVTTPEGAAQDLVTAFCGWHISPVKTETLVLDGTGSRTLILPSLHVTDVLELVNDGTVVDPESFDWSKRGMIELRSGRFSRRFRSISVSLTHGYDFMPAQVQTVIDQLTASGIGPQPVQVGQVRVETASGWVSAESILAPYRLPSRP